MQGVDFIFSLIILIMSVVVHELSHGYVAYALGDPTAKYEGRLTLNPLKHLDFFGSFLVPLVFYLSGGFLFGWAKPVPFNPYNIKRVNQKLGAGIIGVAGPISNFLIAAIFSLALRYGGSFIAMTQSLVNIFTMVVMINVSLACFNLVPIPPLDGSKVLFAFLPRSLGHIEELLERYGFILLFVLILFFANLISPAISAVLNLFFKLAGI
jgi:Zn-dependent protease